jgi:repressor of nif and glnA expression
MKKKTIDQLTKEIFDLLEKSDYPLSITEIKKQLKTKERNERRED